MSDALIAAAVRRNLTTTPQRQALEFSWATRAYHHVSPNVTDCDLPVQVLSAEYKKVVGVGAHPPSEPGRALGGAVVTQGWALALSGTALASPSPRLTGVECAAL